MTEIERLKNAHCQPRKGAGHRLERERIAALLAELPGWELVEDDAAIRKTFQFPDYYHSIAFVNALAWIAHREDHHPDLGVHYNRVVVRLSTHDVGGLSENDIICAARLEALTADRR